MALRDKYNQAIQVAKSLRMAGAAEERDGKLYFKGTVASQDEVNKIWDAIKTVPTWQQEVIAEIKATSTGTSPTKTGVPVTPAGVSKPQQHVTYTVKPGDTLSKIAKEHLGDANAYMELFNANRDQLTDPNRIQPGQVLKVPQLATKAQGSSARS